MANARACRPRSPQRLKPAPIPKAIPACMSPDQPARRQRRQRTSPAASAGGGAGAAGGAVIAMALRSTAEAPFRDLPRTHPVAKHTTHRTMISMQRPSRVKANRGPTKARNSPAQDSRSPVKAKAEGVAVAVAVVAVAAGAARACRVPADPRPIAPRLPIEEWQIRRWSSLMSPIMTMPGRMPEVHRSHTRIMAHRQVKAAGSAAVAAAAVAAGATRPKAARRPISVRRSRTAVRPRRPSSRARRCLRKVRPPHRNWL